MIAALERSIRSKPRPTGVAYRIIRMDKKCVGSDITDDGLPCASRRVDEYFGISLGMPGDYLDGVEAIAKFLAERLGRVWTPRQVRYAREQCSLPIRMKPAVGIYAFKSELLAALAGPDSLPGSDT